MNEIKSYFQLFIDVSNMAGVLLGKQFIGNQITPNEVSQCFLRVHKHIFPEDYQKDSSCQIHWLLLISSSPDLLQQLCFLETVFQASETQYFWVICSTVMSLNSLKCKATIL